MFGDLVGIGGDLGVTRLLHAYKNGIFPWYNPGEPIMWWCPRKRFVIFPENVHISRSMKKMLRQTPLEVKFDTDFEGVIRNCKILRKEGTWITDDMEKAYVELFRIGHAMCAEVYRGAELVGGLYGVVIGKCFFGESMFSRVANASKLALICLCKKLVCEGFLFIDCQFHTPHLESMGGVYISWDEYMRLMGMGNNNGATLSS